MHNLFNEKGISSVVIDGDIFRASFCSDLGYSLDDRQENIRRAAAMARMVIDSGVIAICSFVSPTIGIRQFAKDIIGANQFVEIYVNTPLSVCIERDTKGLYRKARKGEAKEVTGISSPYEIPLNPYLQIDTSAGSREELTSRLFGEIKKKYL